MINYLLQKRRFGHTGLLGTVCTCSAILASAVINTDAAQIEASANAADLTLWYSKPATKWEEALPVGNGHMGAMVFGGIASERIQFNEDTLWKGKPHDYARQDAHMLLPELRRLIADGKAAEAVALARPRYLGDPVRQKPYQPFGDIRLIFPGIDTASVSNYRRELDLDSAIATTIYTANGVTYRREVFASYPDRVIICRITADKPASVSVTIKMNSPHADTTTRVGADAMKKTSLVMCGQIEEGGVRFESRLLVRNEGGTVVAGDDGESLAVERADAVTLRLVGASSYKNFQDISGDPAALCDDMVTKLAARDTDSIRAAHLADHRALFRRVSFTLGRTEKADAPTDQRVRQLNIKGSTSLGLAADPDLAALYFQYGRYLLIACSRPGSQPANLQGVWNELKDPPWESKFTTNINFEMNYWPAELMNLSECHEPLFDLVDDAVVSGRRSAKAYYNISPGWVLHHNTDGWRGTAPVNNIDGIWTTGGAWLCHHLWEHYRFTGDRDFLAKRAYPVLKEASQFFMAFLVKDEKTGWLVSTPSFSPEQGTLCIGATMDHQIIRALFDYTIEAARIIGGDAEFAAQVAKIRAQLAPNLIGKHGQLQEWMEDVDKPGNNHRHMSPLFALYPGTEITPSADQKMYDAAKLLLKWRGDGSTGWSFAWRIPLWARAHDGDMAFKQLNGIITKRTLPNLFDLCGPFQIDGNFGAPAGMAEMLLQSHQRTVGGASMIELLPALPRDWATGEVRGLCARGGFEVDITWTAGAVTRAVIRSKLGNPCEVRVNGRTVKLETKIGGEYVINGIVD